jgi:hypothetical protein
VPRAKRDPEAASKRPSKRATSPEAEPQQAGSSAGLDEEIRRRAYEIYHERGGQGGTADEDWYRAEAEVRQRRERSA